MKELTVICTLYVLLDDLLASTKVVSLDFLMAAVLAS